MAPRPVRIEAIGMEAQPLCILDDVAPDPGAPRDAAAAARGFGRTGPIRAKGG
ncbi:MAG: hypothetical protein ACREB7_09910 [Sphingopyxis sp.]|uniref:hypothetical protein n=1 Tax=Sphingopyxis sp. TaxID=1908224 RepID=UPI003D6D2FEC